MLTVGGRYVCGNPNSLMPVWSDTGNPPGPLNYRQIEELIAFIRATNDQTYIDPRRRARSSPKIDPVTGKVKTFNGWRDPNYKPAPGATPYPGLLDRRVHRRRRRRPGRRGAVGVRRAAAAAPSGRPTRPSPARRRQDDRVHDDRRSTAPADTAVRHRLRQPGRRRRRTTSRSRTRPAPRSSRATIFPGVASADYRCRRSRPGTYTVRLHGAPDHDRDADRTVSRRRPAGRR